MWHPIETAPKDGTVILVLSHGKVFAAYWGQVDTVHGANSDKRYPWVILDPTNGLNAMWSGPEGAVLWRELPDYEPTEAQQGLIPIPEGYAEQ